jgi:hypothetical protein|tara:strand:- start:254 stop:391 length:138 start_codon:yes stop_codon:yes gene_type:complete
MGIENKKKKMKAILFVGKPKEIEPHFEDLKKRYNNSLKDCIEDLR